MKKLLFTCLLSAIAACAFSQNIHIGLKGGVNFATQIYDLNYNLPPRSITGFNAGAILNVDLPANFTIQPGISFTTKGGIIPSQPLSSSSSYIMPQRTYNLSYIEAAANIFYNIRVVPAVRIQLGGGGYLAHGVSAKYNSKPVTFGREIGGDFKNPDYGINFIGGVELKKKILIDAGYSLGLANIANGGGATIKNRVTSVTVGYLF